MVITSGDYIDLAGPDCPDEVIEVLSRALDLPASAWDDTCDPLLRTEWGRIEMILDYATAGPGTARLAIAELNGDAETRRATALRVYQALATATRWALRWSDDCTGQVAARDIDGTPAFGAAGQASASC